MKRILFSVLTLIGLTAQAQIKMPAASPTQTLSQDFGMGKIDITYSRPALKGRAAFGNGSVLAPTGVVWRTGANGATKLTFSHPVTVGGKLLAAGSYALFTIPGSSAWTIIINTNSNSWGSFSYKEAEDVVRFQVKPTTTSNSTENFTINVDDIKEAMRTSGRHVSMDAPFVQGEENSLLDVLENDGDEKPDDGLMNDSLRKEVQRALSTLTSREADVITLYFGLNGEHAMTLEEIGEKFNLTRERVRQIKEKAIRRLRHTSRSKTLKPYLG